MGVTVTVRYGSGVTVSVGSNRDGKSSGHAPWRGAGLRDTQGRVSHVRGQLYYGHATGYTDGYAY